jgi:hypothetical protein
MIKLVLLSYYDDFADLSHLPTGNQLCFLVETVVYVKSRIKIDQNLKVPGL